MLTYANGRITAHEVVGILHSGGTKFVANTHIAMIAMKQSRKATQKRFQILGTSSQKFDLSTSWSICQDISRKWIVISANLFCGTPCDIVRE
jgi:hypothetical protein